MPKVNTLLNYFGKSPSTSNANTGGENSSSSPSSSKSSKQSPKNGQGNESSPLTSKATSEGNEASSGKRSVNGRGVGESSKSNWLKPAGIATVKYEVFDLVWARLEGYPYWPSIVCAHPKTLDIRKKDRGIEYLHVQFFDDPPQRAWIKLTDIKPYTGPDHPIHKVIVKPNLKKAIEWCQEAFKMEKNARHTLIVELKLSDEEDEGESPIEKDNGHEARNDEAETQKQSQKLTQRKRKRSSNESRLKKARVIDSDSEEDASAEIAGDANDDYQPIDVSSHDDEEEENMDISGLGGFDSEEMETSTSKKNKKSSQSKESKWTKAKPDKRSNDSFNTSSSILSAFHAADDDIPFSEMSSKEASAAAAIASQSWPHLSFAFLKESNRKDAEGRPVTDPNHDPKTLYVPPSFLKDQTPAHKQWWELKSKHFDTILFFKVGKFYELFHMDAVIGAQELQLLFMAGKYAHCGFPERGYQAYADRLVSRGYKVARVEQTEKPEDMSERVKKTPKNVKADKVVTREICRITTPATRTPSVVDVGPTDEPAYMIALANKAGPDETIIYGLTFIDVSIGTFHVGLFVDDKKCSKLKTIFQIYPPTELLLERGIILPQTQEVVDVLDSSVKIEILKPDREFWTPKKTLKHLSKYYDWKKTGPEVLCKMLDINGDLVSVKPEYELVFRSLGAVIHTLKTCLIDHQVITMDLFTEFSPPPLISADKPKEAQQSKMVSNMIIDSIALKNLEIFSNSIGDTKGSLMSLMNNCHTKSGSRVMRLWLSSPLCDIDAINQRLDAVEDLKRFKETSASYAEVVDMLKGLHDLERSLAQIHAQSSIKVNSDHPDSRAVMFEKDTYSRKKISSFIAVLNGFKKAEEILKICSEFTFRAKLLVDCLNKKPLGVVPDMGHQIEHFFTAFNLHEAKETGKIIPEPGVDDDYDKALKCYNDLLNELEEYRKKQCKIFKCNVKYVHSGKLKYQLEIQEDACKSMPDGYGYSSCKKGYKRYLTREITELVAKLDKAEDQKEAVVNDITRKMFAKFDEHYHDWMTVAKSIALFDCLLSLQLTRERLEMDGAICCRPVFLNQEKQILSLKNSKHPTILKFCDNFIPNDIELDDKLMLITGPNMGGKSTLMRQCGLITVMAHIGCYVPAEKCSLTLTDRIFTRLGATDRILEGQSTFLVELNETSVILECATANSLVILDELGRGTSTFDGTAIASSVVNEISTRIKCRSLFSTHYHSLIEEFKDKPDSVNFMHMSCQVENEDFSDPSKESITFLYKLIPGSCPKSYGFNAAKLAGIPEDIIKEARETAQNMEAESLFRKLFSQNLSINEARRLVNAIPKVN